MPTTVILGGGIIGLSTAYYLSQFTTDSTTDSKPTPKHHIHLVEPSPEFFSSASGKAAGFLAKDWFAPAVAPLGAFSFDLHRKLASEFNGRERWGWSESESYSLDRDFDGEGEEPEPPIGHPEPGSEAAAVAAGKERATSGSRTQSTDLEWLMSGSSRATLLDESLAGDTNPPTAFPPWIRVRRGSMQCISDRTSTGQVDPLRLCDFLLEASKARGVVIHQPARATALIPTASSSSFASDSSTSIRIQHLAPTAGLEFGTEVNPRRSPSPSSYEDAAHFGTPTETIDIPVDNIIIAAGCWSPRVYRTLFPNASRIPRISALAGHSVIMKSKHWTPMEPEKVRETAKADSVQAHIGIQSPKGTKTDIMSHAIFTSDPAGYSPEIFSRVSGDVWLGGLNSSSIPLPPLPNLAKPDPEAINTLVDTGRALCGSDVEVIGQGLCFRPVAPTGRPIVGRVHGADLGDGEGVSSLGNRQDSEQLRGVYVATGHGPWGISLSLGTGYVMSEMVLGRPTSVDVKALARWEAQAP